MDLYFDCGSGISGDMSVAALLDLGADREKLDSVLKSINLDNEFKYVISKRHVNSISTTDFDVILPDEGEHHHEEHHHHDEHHEHHHGHNHHIHRNLDDVNAIIEKSSASDSAKTLAKRIFQIVAEAEAKVHGKDIKEVHVHEVGAIDSIADILSCAVLFEDLKPEKVYFSPLTEGRGFVECQHGRLSVPVPAVCEMLSFDHCDGHDGEKDAENSCAYHQMLAIENANPFKIVEKEDGLHGLSLWRSEEPIVPYETKEWLCIKRPKCPLPQFGERVSGLRAPPVVG